MKKIGRNDPCPCKSGKKYKFCCLLKGVVYPQSNSIEKSNSVFSINNYFKLYNTFDLLSTLGALSLEPGNHGKYLRINYLLWEAVICNSNSNKIIHPNELNTVLSKHFGDNVMEDPPENIFTENVTCSAGNKTVFGGNFEQGVFTLNLIIKVTNYFRESIPTELLNKIYPAQHILLFLSDIIAVRVGHVKNIKGDNENSSELIFPKDLERYKESLWFERSLLIKYCDDLNLDIEGIKPFILKIEDLEENNANIQSIEENPISTKPIIELEHGYLVISPSNIVQALVHFTFAQAEMYGCLQIFLNEFHRLVWHELMFYLKNIGFENIKYSFNSNEKILFKPSLFKFDENKYALLIFCADNGTHYNSLTPFQDDLSSQGLFTSGSYSTLINGIKFNFPSCTLLQMNVYSSIGRSYILFGKNNKEEYSFITTAYQLICLLKSGDFDNFTLWNFERAKKMLLRDVMVMPMNFIDLFTLYQNKNNSFYLNDEKRPTHLFIPPGSGIELIYKAVIREDPMVAYYNSVEFTYPILLPVIKVNDYILRYASWEKNSDYIEYFLPDFPFDLWVRSGKMKENMIIIEYKTYWEFNEAICYWLLEVRNDLHKHLEPLPNLVITITHDFNDSFFDDQFILENKNNNLADEIIITANKDFINIKIPKTIDKYIRKPDNEGERILLSKLLEGFGMLLEINNLKNTLDTITILEILDVKAPLGLKKMLLLLNTNIDIAFDPRYLIEKRYLQEGNRQIIIDEEIPRLGSKCPRPGDFLSKEQKLKLTRDLVFEVHLKNLREILSEYNSVDLIKYFMSLNESLVHELSLIRIRTPTREKCFKDKEDIVNKLVNQINLSDETTLAVRCLIEHLAA